MEPRLGRNPDRVGLAELMELVPELGVVYSGGPFGVHTALAGIGHPEFSGRVAAEYGWIRWRLSDGAWIRCQYSLEDGVIFSIDYIQKATRDGVVDRQP